MTKQQLQDELKQSMLARNSEKTSVIRMILSALNYYEINKGGAGYVATDEDVMTVLQNQAKQRRDSIEQFTAGNRPELAEKEQKELEMISEYLPAQMGEDEIRSLVKQAITATGASTPQEMGKVMGALMPKTKGKADGGLISKIVREELSSKA
ncbi:MAG TPA: GatB/YqeY domain-containing protein [Patescibacteria group bacterium]|nr:GatB/YqeY domain-containing protein [Patescibacteria group bacterium]